MLTTLSGLPSYSYQSSHDLRGVARSIVTRCSKVSSSSETVCKYPCQWLDSLGSSIYHPNAYRGKLDTVIHSTTEVTLTVPVNASKFNDAMMHVVVIVTGSPAHHYDLFLHSQKCRKASKKNKFDRKVRYS